jgi:hypothetical protein
MTTTNMHINVNLQFVTNDYIITMGHQTKDNWTAKMWGGHYQSWIPVNGTPHGQEHTAPEASAYQLRLSNVMVWYNA